jgi:putative ATP-dependent endonuclease of the OLD family
VNNGNPATFTSLARALSIPWLAVFDGDNAGHGYVEKITAREFPAAFVASRCRCLPAGNLEQQLLADGFDADMRGILQSLGHADALEIDRAELEKRLDKNKTAYAAELVKRLAADATLGQYPNVLNRWGFPNRINSDS